MKPVRRPHPLPENDFFQDAQSFRDGFIVLKKSWLSQAIAGSVYSTDEVVVEKDAVIEGDLVCKSCTVKGRVTGNVYAWVSLVADESAVIDGDVSSRCIATAEGTLIRGRISMSNISMPYYLSEYDPNGLARFFEREQAPEKKLAIVPESIAIAPQPTKTTAVNPVASPAKAPAGDDPSGWW